MLQILYAGRGSRLVKVPMLIVALGLPMLASASWWNWWDDEEETGGSTAQGARDVIFVGNNWEGMIDVIDMASHERLGRINGLSLIHI